MGPNTLSGVPLVHPRLFIDPDVSPDVPCVKGTWVTVDAIKAMRDKGHTIRQILDRYRELEAKDILVALTYRPD